MPVLSTLAIAMAIAFCTSIHSTTDTATIINDHRSSIALILAACISIITGVGAPQVALAYREPIRCSLAMRGILCVLC